MTQLMWAAVHSALFNQNMFYVILYHRTGRHVSPCLKRILCHSMTVVCHHHGWHCLKSVNCKHMCARCQSETHICNSLQEVPAFCFFSLNTLYENTVHFSSFICERLHFVWVIIFLIEINTFSKRFVRLIKGSDFRSIFNKSQKSR